MEDSYEYRIKLLDEKFRTYLKNEKSFFADEDEFISLINYYHTSNKNVYALLALNKALSYYPHSDILLLMKGVYFFKRQQWNDALTFLVEAYKENTINPDTLVYLSLTLLYLGNFVEAKNFFRRYIDVDVEDYFIFNMIDTAEFILDSIYQISPTESLYSNKPTLSKVDVVKVKMVLELLDKIINTDSDFNNLVCDKMAICYFLLDQYETSISYLKKSLELEPFYQNNWVFLSVLYFMQNMINEAIDAVDYAIAIKPDFDEAHYFKGYIYFFQDDFANALESYKKITSSTFDDMNTVFYNMGVCYQMLDDKKQSVRYYLKALKNNPHDIRTLITMGFLYLEQNDFKNSAYYLDIAQEEDEDNPVLNYALADLMLHTKDYDQSLIYIRKSLSQYPFDKDYILFLSDLYRAQGKINKSIAVLLENLNTVDEKEYLLYSLAGLYMQSGKSTNAVKYLKMAIREDSSLIPFFLETFPEAKEYNKFKGLLNLPSF